MTFVKSSNIDEIEDSPVVTIQTETQDVPQIQSLDRVAVDRPVPVQRMTQHLVHHAMTEEIARKIRQVPAPPSMVQTVGKFVETPQVQMMERPISVRQMTQEAVMLLDQTSVLGQD